MKTKRIPPGAKYTAEMDWTLMLAWYLANRRGHRQVQIEDCFGGLYLAARDRVAQTWQDGASLDHFARTACELTDPPWFYWIEFHAWMRRESRKAGSMACSKAAANVLSRATHLASRKLKDKAKVPEVTVEHFLDMMAQEKQSRFGRQMVDCGFDLQKTRRRLGSRKLRNQGTGEKFTE